MMINHQNLKREETIDFHVRWSWHKIVRLYNQKAEEYGFTMSIGYVLLSVDQEGTPSTQLAPRMGMEASSLTRTLKNMETQGLIYRVPDTVDKRVVKVFLTEEGIEKRKLAKEGVLYLNSILKEKLGNKNWSVLLKNLQEVALILDEIEM